MTTFQNKYRIESIRLPGYDYSRPGAYFVTIVTYQRQYLFGNIINGKMILNEYGEIVKNWWQEIPNHYSNGQLDVVEAIHELPLQQQNTRKIRRKMLLPKIIGYFKMNAAKQINKLQQSQKKLIWQRNYYEHIIRNDDELNRIRLYIFDNPSK
jgi:REP element-mobilizing transposase RayT